MYFPLGLELRHGTGTALVTLVSDLWGDWDGGNASIFDLSMAFSTIDHRVLLNQLQRLKIGGHSDSLPSSGFSFSCCSWITKVFPELLLCWMSHEDAG